LWKYSKLPEFKALKDHPGSNAIPDPIISVVNVFADLVGPTAGGDTDCGLVI
jgi:hypothetical protein